MGQNWFKNKIQKIKVKIIEHFKIENLFYNLVDLFKFSLIISIGIDEIYFGTKNPKRFKLCVLNHILNLFVCLCHFSPLINDYMYSLIKNPFLPAELIILTTLFLIQVSVMRVDISLGEINYNLSPFKIFYWFAKDIKSKHKLTEQNYNRLVILFRTFSIGLFYYTIPIVVLVAIAITSIILIKTSQLYWLFVIIVVMPFYINGLIVLTSGGLIVICLISYYKMRFDQLHYKIKSIIPNGNWKYIIKRKEKLLLGLIHEHNELSVQIHAINMMVGRSIASYFIYISLIKIDTLYLTLNTKDLLIKLFAINAFTLYFIFGLAAAYLFSHQIKSAHQSLELLHLIVCRYKMKLKLRFKVKVIRYLN